jgi:hypothetical protein
MVSVRCLLAVSLLCFCSTMGLSQNSKSAAEEEVIQKTTPDRKLDKDDVRCGNYLWISTKTGTKFLYYFFGGKEWGESRLGFYQQNLYRVIVSAQKDPPTVQRVVDSDGGVTEVRIRMTGPELAASSACLTQR